MNQRTLIRLMTSSFIAAVLTSLTASIAFAANADDPGVKVLDCVHATLGSDPSWTADFNQSQHLAVLSTPLLSRGRVEVSAGSIRWEMLSPITDVLTIDSQGMIRSEHGETMNHPAIADTIRLLLTLDVTGLKRSFGIGGSCAAGAWVLQLRPVDGVLTKVFSGIEISGRSTVEGVVLRSPNADFTEIRFGPAKSPSGS
jgi:hypothetical protein